jgi:hypothetical protein
MPARVFARSARVGAFVFAIAGSLFTSSSFAQNAEPSAQWEFPLLQVADVRVDEVRVALAEPLNNPAAQRGATSSSEEAHLRSDQLPAIETIGVSAPRLREDELIGSYGQPRWTATRLFPSTRVYVIPEGKREVEYWFRPTFDDGERETRMLAEFEVGLPHRLQLDLYFRTDQENTDADLLHGEQIELRWALADWGRIPGNPTLYLEWIELEGRPNKIEPKLLLGGDITEGWHWGVNIVAEMEYEGPEREHEYELTTGIVHTIKDSVFSVGAAFKTSWVDVSGDRGNYDRPALIGPSFHWHPVPQWSINLETLVGFGSDSPDGQLTLNTGWEF